MKSSPAAKSLAVHAVIKILAISIYVAKAADALVKIAATGVNGLINIITESMHKHVDQKLTMIQSSCSWMTIRKHWNF